MRLYHGSVSIIEKPELGKGNHKNDYGLGLYCTEHVELAKEWACSTGKDGFVNVYELNVERLTECNLTQGHILNWMAILLENRTFDLSATLLLQLPEIIFWKPSFLIIKSMISSGDIAQMIRTFHLQKTF